MSNLSISIASLGTENRRRARKVNLKRNAETADYDRITLITNRAGFSSDMEYCRCEHRGAVNLGREQPGGFQASGSTTVVLNEPHSYERGTYITDTGVGGDDQYYIILTLAR